MEARQRRRLAARPALRRALEPLGSARPQRAAHGPRRGHRADLGGRLRLRAAAHLAAACWTAAQLREDPRGGECRARSAHGLAANAHRAGRHAQRHPAGGVGRLTLQAARNGRLRPSGLRAGPPHHHDQLLPRLPVGRNRAGGLPLPPRRERLERHWLQHAGRQVRPGLRRSAGGHRRARDRRPGGRLQHGVHGRGHDRQLQLHSSLGRRRERARARARVEAVAPRRPGAGADHGDLERRTRHALPAGRPGHGQPHLGPPRRGLHRLPRQRAVRAAARPAPARGGPRGPGGPPQPGHADRHAPLPPAGHAERTAGAAGGTQRAAGGERADSGPARGGRAAPSPTSRWRPTAPSAARC